MSSVPFITKSQKAILEAAYQKLLAKENLTLGQAFSPETVTVLVERGLLVIEKMESLKWAKDKPRVERIETVEIARLTEEGERIAKSLTTGP